VRFRLTDLPALLATSAGREQIRRGLGYRAWPVSSRIAQLHRLTLARRTRVVAIVGSFGKTTTARAIAAVLGQPLQGTLGRNAFSAVAGAVLRIAPGQRHAVIEVGIADIGQMRPYARTVRPDVTVVTAIGSEHHRSLGTLAVTRDEKAWMLRALPASGIAVLNGDDPNVTWMRGETRARIVTFGLSEACDVRARNLRFDWPHGSRFDLTAFGETVTDIRVRLFGEPMVRAALAAIAVARSEGVALADALARLEGLAPTPGRMEPVALPGGVTILRDDHKGAIETMGAALAAFAGIPAKRRIVVLGEITEPPAPQRASYRAVGAQVASAASLFVVVGRMLDSYSVGARRAGMPAEAIVDGGRTAASAAAVLRPLLREGDVVLVTGRGTQALDRVRLILEGRDVRCDITFCTLRRDTCDGCGMLERGWAGRRPVM
jgi:UDP-N-acetylmuramyl pentapeptide synthase